MLLVMEGQKAVRFHQKYLAVNLCGMHVSSLDFTCFESKEWIFDVFIVAKCLFRCRLFLCCSGFTSGNIQGESEQLSQSDRCYMQESVIREKYFGYSCN